MDLLSGRTRARAWELVAVKWIVVALVVLMAGCAVPAEGWKVAEIKGLAGTRTLAIESVDQRDCGGWAAYSTPWDAVYVYREVFSVKDSRVIETIKTHIGHTVQIDWQRIDHEDCKARTPWLITAVREWNETDVS